MHCINLSLFVKRAESTNLSAELEVDHDDGDLRARHDENDEDEEQEPEQVVELVLPDRLSGRDISINKGEYV